MRQLTLLTLLIQFNDHSSLSKGLITDEMLTSVNGPKLLNLLLHFTVILLVCLFLAPASTLNSLLVCWKLLQLKSYDLTKEVVL